MTKCVCGHDKMEHDTERDSGWHNGACSECLRCTAYFSFLGIKRGLKQGMIYSSNTMRMYYECLQELPVN